MSEEESKTVKTFYALPNGRFGIVEMSREDKKHIDNLLKLLNKLKVTSPIDRNKLMATWKQYDRDNVRKWGSIADDSALTQYIASGGPRLRMGEELR